VRKKTRAIVLFVLVIIIFGFVFYQLDAHFKNPEDVQDYVNSFGYLGPIVIITLIILEVIIAPLPGVVIALGSGAAFGWLKGALYGYIGNIIGTIIAFMLSRHFGRPLAKRLIKGKKLDYYDKFFREKGVYGLWVAYMLPIFPTDIISFVTGLSNIKFTKFLKIILIGYIPNMLILTFFGDRILRVGFSLNTIVIGSVLGIIFLIAIIWTFKPKKI